jgi:hypothetical protein
MSGGHFNYQQYQITNIADEVEQLIDDNNSDELDEYGYKKGCNFLPETIEEFKIGLEYLRKAQIYAHRIDWLVSGDDGEDTFHKRLQDDLKELEDKNG